MDLDMEQIYIEKCDDNLDHKNKKHTWINFAKRFELAHIHGAILDVIEIFSKVEGLLNLYKTITKDYVENIYKTHDEEYVGHILGAFGQSIKKLISNPILKNVNVNDDDDPDRIGTPFVV